MSTKNFFRLSHEEQRAILASAIQNADPEQEKKLIENYDLTQSAKHGLVHLINEILNHDYTVNDKIVFTQTENGDIEVTTE